MLTYKSRETRDDQSAVGTEQQNKQENTEMSEVMKRKRKKGRMKD